jgi:hypothetical protein
MDLLITYTQNSELQAHTKIIDNLNAVQITRVEAKSSRSAFASRFQVTDPNNGDSSASVLTSLLCGEYATTRKST